jgi:hypothetical protein
MRPAVVARLARTLGITQSDFRRPHHAEPHMHHKRQRPKSRRAGCLLCKPNKMNGWPRNELGHAGFGKIRREVHALHELHLVKHETE